MTKTQNETMCRFPLVNKEEFIKNHLIGYAGQLVTALSEAELLEEAARHIARYKLPKAFVFVDKVLRSPSGKADYRWAKSVAAG